MLAPAAFAFACLFGLGLGGAFLESVEGPGGWTLERYRALVAAPEFVASLRFTIAVSVTATVLSAVLGLAMALAMRPAIRRTPRLLALLQTPVAIPHLAMALVVINVAAPSGLMARVGWALGVIGSPADFPELLNDAWGAGIILVYVLKEAPFIALVTLASLLRLGAGYDDVARTLGASAWQRLRYVTIPLAAPALLSSSVIVLAFVFNAFEVPYLTGRPYPAMLAILAQRRFFDAEPAARPEAMAIAMVMFAVTALLCWVYFRAARSLAGPARSMLP